MDVSQLQALWPEERSKHDQPLDTKASLVGTPCPVLENAVSY